MIDRSTVTIAVVGPECSGKTTLSLALAGALGCPWVPEHARAYLGATGSDYAEDDLLRIARGQVLGEERALAERPPFLVCDTDLVTMLIWSRERYGRCDPWIGRVAATRGYTHRLLCTPEMPWERDPLREAPNDRARLFATYVATLEELGLPHTIIRGSPGERLAHALALVRRG